MKIDILTTDCTERLGNRLWVLTQPFIFTIDGKSYTIPTGFVTDGASCPRPLWSICSPVAGPFGQGAIPHDWFYNEGPDIGRLQADMVLYAIGRFRGANIARAQAVKSGVNMFGWMNYKKGIDKLTDAACYDLEKARVRVAELISQRSPGQLITV